ncbi:hypothetical protein JCM10908_001877 [Rhodotorula pacifica]|uniref:uncharacterized protein n=1 Tax=Rhodotorula pacifica TaxID=1495444 RepID=UPI00316C9602
MQPGPSRPVTFALPPSPRLREDALLATGLGGTTPPATPPAFDRSNPFNSTTAAAASPSGASFLSRLSRKLSVGKSSLSRRASKGSRRGAEPESPQMARGVSFAEPIKDVPKTASTAVPCECASRELDTAPVNRRSSTGLGLRRSLRVGGGGGGASALRRAKSEGTNARRPRAIAEVSGDASPLQRRSTGGQVPSNWPGGAGAGEARPQAAEVHSSLGSYYWTDSLGVCWDGRERVHPDLLFAVQPYTSDADFIPAPQARSPGARVVYASTLSSFPPRPPLRPRSPELSPAAQIIADYRAKHGTITPSLRSFSLGPAEEEEEEGETDVSTVTASTLQPPSPVPDDLRIAISSFATEARTDSPVSTRSSTSRDVRDRFAYASPGGHSTPGGGGTEDGHPRAVSQADSDTSVEEDEPVASEVSPSSGAAHATKPTASRPLEAVRSAA